MRSELKRSNASAINPLRTLINNSVRNRPRLLVLSRWAYGLAREATQGKIAARLAAAFDVASFASDVRNARVNVATLGQPIARRRTA